MSDNMDISSPKPIEGSIEERFDVFVQAFVSKFVEKYTKYTNIAKPGGKGNVGKRTENVLKTVEDVTKLIPPAYICAQVITFLTRLILARHNKDKAESTTKYEYDAEELIKEVKNIAGDIFYHYEYQFVNISANWRNGIEYMAKRAVKRLFNYCADNFEGSENNISSLFIKGVVLGEDKWTKWQIDKCTTRTGFRGTKVNPSALYRDPGLYLPDDGNKYYKRKGQKVLKFGYRRMFRWEQIVDYEPVYKISEEDKYVYKWNKYDLVKRLGKMEFGEAIKVLENELKIIEYITLGISFQEKGTVDSFVGRQDELEELHSKIWNNKESVIKSITCVTGIRGIGKTELVRKYSDLYDNNIIWIEAENESSLMVSFGTLAEKLSIKYLEDDVAKHVYKYFEKKKCLFIFDNAESIDGIYKFLPENQKNAQGVYIVVTSYNRNWNDCKIVDLKGFIDKDAVEFFKKKKIQFEKDVDIKQLIHTLDYLPLALDQCAAYIKDQESNIIIPKCTIENYIEKYKKEKKSLLNYNRGNHFNYNKTIFCTYTLLIEKMESYPDIGTTATLVLEIVAYFSADYIPIALFIDENLADLESLNEAFKLLVRYSIISLNEHQNLFKVNRLIQDIMKTRLENKSKEKIFEPILELLENFKEYHDHLLLMYPHLQNILNNLDGTEGEIIRRLRKFILGKVMDVIDVDKVPGIENKLNQDYDLAKEIYGENSIEFVNTLMKHGNIYAKLEYYDKQKECFEKALKISQEELYPSEHIEIYKIKLKLGIAYLNTGNIDQSIENIESALTKFRQKFGNDSYDVALALNNLSNVYTELEDHQKARDLLLKSLKIFENVFGNDHIILYCVLDSLMGSYKLLGDEENEKQIKERISNSRYIKMYKQF